MLTNVNKLQIVDACLLTFSSIKIITNSSWHELYIKPGSIHNRDDDNSIGAKSGKFPKSTNQVIRQI